MGGGGHVVGTHKWMKASNRFRWNITGSSKRLIGRIILVLICQPKRWHANSLVTCKLIASVFYLPGDSAGSSPARMWCLLTRTVSPLTQEQKPSPYFFTPSPARGTVGVSTGSPDDSRCDLGAKEDAQVADCVGGEHSDDGEGDGEVFIQRTWGIWTHTHTQV